MEIVVNGERESSEPCTIADLVMRRGLDAGALVVELNRAVAVAQRWGD